MSKKDQMKGLGRFSSFCQTATWLSPASSSTRQPLSVVEALSPVTLCVFERSRLNNLFTDHPTLAYDLTWIAASEERMLDNHLLSIGRRTAIERAAYLIAFLYSKAKAVNLVQGETPISSVL